jgi:phosphatidylethanolamine-binding protein (PEBP) family uncharacterized protein
MRNALISTTLTALLAAASMGCSADGSSEPTSDFEQADNGNHFGSLPFQVTTPSFTAGGVLPAQYTCQDNTFGTGVSPQIDWTKGPTGTKSYAIVLHDISLSDSNVAYHWAAWNIPHDRHTLPEGIQGLIPSDPTLSNPFPEGLKGGQQVQARGLSRYFAPCPDWVVRKAIKCNWSQLPVAVPDSYTFTVYALPEAELEVPPYIPAVDNNYVHQLDAIFAGMALGSAEIAFTSAAVPGAIADVGPFNCNNQPKEPVPAP